MEDCEHRRPCEPTAPVKFRKLLGEAGAEELLARAVNAAVNRVRAARPASNGMPRQASARLPHQKRSASRSA
jgi:hypothetical protein